MGTLGSGRWGGHTKKTTVEECSALSIRMLKEALEYGPGYGGRVWWTCRGEEKGSISFGTEKRGSMMAVRLIYTITNRATGGQQDYSYPVAMQTTHPYFGGVRWWFTCPLVVGGNPCSRRVGKLYLPPGGEYFGCRHCYDLSYRSRQEYDKRVVFYQRHPELLLDILESNEGKSLSTIILAMKA